MRNRLSTAGVTFFIGLLCMIGGCQTGPHPSPGLAAVEVKVIAEPKAGVVSAHVATYDQSAGTGYGDFEKVDYSDLGDIVVWLEPTVVDIPVAPPAASARIDVNSQASQGGLAGVASAGQKIVFHNNGNAPLSAYSVSDGNPFNLGVIAPGGEAETVAKSAGLIELISDTVQEPIARIYVAPSPWVALTRSGANVDFNNLSPGVYQIMAWHPRLPGNVVQVRLVADQVARESVTIGVNRLPKIETK